MLLLTSSLEESVGDLAWPVGVSMQERSVRSASMLPLRGPLFPELPMPDVGLLPAGLSPNSKPCIDIQALILDGIGDHPR